MITADLLTTWVSLSPLERASVREVYFRDQSMTQTAHRCRTGVAEVSRALQSAYRRIAAFILEPQAAGGSAEPMATAVQSLVEVPTAAWRWDTSREEMTWSDSMFDLYGYPIGAVRPTIGLHQSHKWTDDRVRAERLVLASATEAGAIVFPQRVIRVDGSVCRVVMRVTRDPGPGEVLTGRVVADLSVAC